MLHLLKLFSRLLAGDTEWYHYVKSLTLRNKNNILLPCQVQIKKTTTHYLELEEEKYDSSSSLYFFLGFVIVGVSCSMICISDTTEWEMPLGRKHKTTFAHKKQQRSKVKNKADWCSIFSENFCQLRYSISDAPNPWPMARCPSVVWTRSGRRDRPPASPPTRTHPHTAHLHLHSCTAVRALRRCLRMRMSAYVTSVLPFLHVHECVRAHAQTAARALVGKRALVRACAWAQGVPALPSQSADRKRLGTAAEYMTKQTFNNTIHFRFAGLWPKKNTQYNPEIQV